MYDELVKRLRDKASGLDYDGWVDTAASLEDAADAIEELSREYESVAASLNESVELVRKLQSPCWIPVTEQNHPKAYEPVMVVYVGWNDALPHRDCTAYWSEDEEVWRWAETNDKVKVPITHYMSLPPLPDATEGGLDMAISEAKMKVVIDNYFKSECDVNTSIREAFEKGFRIGVQKGMQLRPEPPKEEAT